MKSTWHQMSLKAAAFMFASLVSLGPVSMAASSEALAQKQTTADKSAAQSTPSIQIADKSHDFGEVMEGAEIRHVFTVKNTGKAPLQITQVRPG